MSHSRYECPLCGSPDVLTQRRPDGDSTCQECGHSDKTAKFDLVELKEDKMEDKKEKEGPQPGPKAAPRSPNGRFILESYKEDRALKATVQNGFAMVSQKVSLKGLKLLADVISPITGQFIAYAGDTAYIREASLQNQPWAKQTFNSDAIEGEFMVVDQTHVEFVDRK